MVENSQGIMMKTAGNKWGTMEKTGRGNGCKQLGDNNENMKEEWVETSRGPMEKTGGENG